MKRRTLSQRAFLYRLATQEAALSVRRGNAQWYDVYHAWLAGYRAAQRDQRKKGRKR